MKIKIIETITFLVTAPYIAWEARQDNETEYYRSLEEIQSLGRVTEEMLYKLQKEAKNETDTEIKN